MDERFVCLVAQPGDNRDTPKAKHQERIMRVAHHTGELHFENLVEHRNNLVFVELCHKTAFLPPYEIDAVNGA